MKRITAFCLALMLAAIFVVPAVKASEIPVETFFKRAQYSRMELSPDGKLLAAVVPAHGRDNLAVIDLEMKDAKLITNFDQSDTVEFHWVSNQRLVFRVADAQEARNRAKYYGWYAVNADGQYVHRLALPAFVREHKLSGADLLVDFEYLGRASDSDDEIIIAAWERGYTVSSIYRLNTRTGAKKLLSLNAPLNPIRWVMDHAGVLRVAYGYDKGIDTVWYRDDEKSPWTKLAEGTDITLSFDVIGFDYDNKTLYVSARNGKDKAGIYIFDTTKKALKEIFLEHPLIDLHNLEFGRAKHKLLGARYEADRPGVVWMDADMDRLQKTVDKALPDTFNRLAIADENPKRALVVAYSDKDPGRFYLLDTEKLSLEELGARRPWIKPEQMSERRFVRYQARDGMEIPAWLTIPKGSGGKNLPLVVNIHGGPWVRGYRWEFDGEAQFFASRGYAVLQPEFRGSTGYGERLYQSSFKQWGLAMQDDITDGVKWLTKEGIVDKDRVCLYGGSYGGYATLWGLIKDPDLYKCGVAFVAVTDIGLMYDIAWSDFAQSSYKWLEYGAKIAIGDPDKDREMLKAVSPLYNTDRLKAPVLLAYGAADVQVPLKHGKKFREALDKYGKKYEWVVYDDEGHGFNKDQNRFDFYKRVDAFLKKHLQ